MNRTARQELRKRAQLLSSADGTFTIDNDVSLVRSIPAAYLSTAIYRCLEKMQRMVVAQGPHVEIPPVIAHDVVVDGEVTLAH